MRIYFKNIPSNFIPIRSETTEHWAFLKGVVPNKSKQNKMSSANAMGSVHDPKSTNDQNIRKR